MSFYLFKGNKRLIIIGLGITLLLVMIVNYIAGVFIGGLLIIATCVSGIVMNTYQRILYMITCLIAFLFSVYVNQMSSKIIIIQGSIYVFTLIVALYVGKDLGRYMKGIHQRKEQNCRLIEELIYAFVTAIDAKDEYLHFHSNNVSYYAREIAQSLGLKERQVEIVALAALLHDIGKLNVPTNILNKPDRLSAREWETMKEHTSDGVKILGNVEGLAFLLPMIKYHHRHFDGSGYPCDMPNELIPMESRIITVADSFDAMTVDRPYRKALSKEAAYSELRKYSGSQFSPEVIDAFFESGIEPVKIKDHYMNLTIIFDE